MEDQASITICLIIVAIFEFYLLVHFSYLYIKTKSLYKVQTTKYDKVHLIPLMKKTIKILRDNANVLAHPYFYSQPIEYILAAMPSYSNVLILCKYIIDNPESQNDITRTLDVLYGSDFSRSKDLNVLVRVKTSDYGTDEYFHYIIGDIDKGMTIYVHNKEYLDKNLMIT